MVYHPLTQGVFGVTEIVWSGAHPQFFWRVPPNPAPGTMASTPGTGVAHRGGEVVTPPQVSGVTMNPVGGTSVRASQWGHPHTALVEGGKQPHRIMAGLLQLDFDVRA